MHCEGQTLLQNSVKITNKKNKTLPFYREMSQIRSDQAGDHNHLIQAAPKGAEGCQSSRETARGHGRREAVYGNAGVHPYHTTGNIHTQPGTMG